MCTYTLYVHLHEHTCTVYECVYLCFSLAATCSPVELTASGFLPFHITNNRRRARATDAYCGRPSNITLNRKATVTAQLTGVNLRALHSARMSFEFAGIVNPRLTATRFDGSTIDHVVRDVTEICFRNIIL